MSIFRLANGFAKMMIFFLRFLRFFFAFFADPCFSSLRPPLATTPYPEFPMGIKCGIVGLPNVGKSTLFNALTQAGIAAANFPFCTIEPNTGVVPVPDPRLGQLAEIVKPPRVLPTAMEVVDIAGPIGRASCRERVWTYV